MAISLAQKLKLRAGSTIRTINAPDNFPDTLLPEVSIVTKGPPDQIHWFVKDQLQLEKDLKGVVDMVKDAVICWVYYPKGSSGIQTDLTRDKGWDKLLAHDEYQWLSLISFDETWSAFGFRARTQSDLRKQAKAGSREIFEYVNPATKEVRLPADLELALKSDPAGQIFDKLAYSHKKEYIEWVITARREETRKQRIAATIEKLSNGWKNPRNS
jgi:hypothetical protein